MTLRSWWGIGLAVALFSLIGPPALAQSMDTNPGREATPADDTVPRKPPAGRPSHRTSWTGDRLALLGHVGIGAPAGAVGLDLDFAPVPWLALNVGFGQSFGGMQLAAMSRFRIPMRTGDFVTFGGGLSTGRYVNARSVAGVFSLLLLGDGEPPAEQTFERANWGNLELGLDLYASDGRGMGRLDIGYGWILNDRAFGCNAAGSYGSGNGCSRTSGQNLVFVSASFGLDI